MKKQFLLRAAAAIAAAIVLFQACNDVSTEDDSSYDDSGCDSTIHCGFPCITSKTDYDYQLTEYGTSTSEVQSATFATAPSSSVTLDFRPSGYHYDIQQSFNFGTQFYFYATDFDQDNAPPYENGNAPGYIHVIAITNLSQVTPGMPFKSPTDEDDDTKKRWYQEYNYTFTLLPRIVGGDSMTSSWVYPPSPDARTKTGSKTMTTHWNMQQEYGAIDLLYYDGSDWEEPAPTNGGYMPAYNAEYDSKSLEYYEVDQIQTDSSSGIYYHMSGADNEDSDIYCDTANGVAFQVLNYFRFPQSALTNDTLMIVFDIEAGMGGKEQKYENEYFCDGEGICEWTGWNKDGDASTDSVLARYHTDTLFLTLWTNGDYNDPSNSSDKKIGTITISKGFWPGK